MGGKRKTDTFLFFLLFVQFNLSYIEKTYFWRQSTGQEWKQGRSFAMGKSLLENVTNLGKMNHSHFIWTSVLTSTPLLHTFIHLWQFYYNLCRCCRSRSQKGMLHGEDPKHWGLVELRCILFHVPYGHPYIWDTHIGLNRLSFASHYDFTQPVCLYLRCEEKRLKDFGLSLIKPELTPF